MVAVTTAPQATPERLQVAQNDTWNVSAMYPTWEAWEGEVKKWGREGDEIHWPEIGRLRAEVGNDPKKWRELIELTLSLDRHLTKLYTYAHLRHDEDVAAEQGKKAYTRMTALLFALRQETAWIEPLILSMDEKTIRSLLQSEELKPYKFYLEKIASLKPHTLTAEMEELIAASGQALQSTSRAFSALNNADLKFAPAIDSQGNSHELTHGKYALYLRSSDRKLRQSAFVNIHRKFLEHENTLCELINGTVQAHLFEARARRYDSCLDAALFPNQIDTQVYRNLIQSVRKRLPELHRYVSLRKKLLGLDALHYYDLYVPLVGQKEWRRSYEDAVSSIVSAVQVLGAEYQETVKKGLTEQRWVDRYENARKRSGAYSSGCYDSFPYILMNFHGSYNDVMTLCHEAGHSLHSYLSHARQPYVYAQYPIFLAEVASTFNEELLFRHLLTSANSPDEKRFLLNQKIDDIRATFFRQVMFAEFELKLHEWAEEGIPLTPALLKAEYRKLNIDYFGPDFTVDPEIDIEWARIPHFYYNFYVYQYATGISAAHALVDQVMKNRDPARYLSFLSSGGSNYPVETLAKAGVDIRSSEAVESIISRFSSLVVELEKN